MKLELMSKLEMKQVHLKLECPHCHKKKRTKCFVYNKKLKLKICKACDRQIGNNIFYVPYKHQESNFIGRYSMSDEEKSELHHQLVSQGMDSGHAWHRVNYTSKMMRINFYKVRKAESIRKRNEIEKKQIQERERKAFLEGLK